MTNEEAGRMVLGALAKLDEYEAEHLERALKIRSLQLKNEELSEKIAQLEWARGIEL